MLGEGTVSSLEDGWADRAEVLLGPACSLSYRGCPELSATWSEGPLGVHCFSPAMISNVTLQRTLQRAQDTVASGQRCGHSSSGSRGVLRLRVPKVGLGWVPSGGITQGLQPALAQLR